MITLLSIITAVLCTEVWVVLNLLAITHED